MPFTSRELLATQIHESKITALLDGIEGDPFAEADALITLYTGIEPPQDATQADKLLTIIASRIVIYHVMGRQQELSNDEWERRKSNYEETMRWLEDIRNGRLKLEPAGTPVGPRFTSDKLRTGAW